METKRAAGLYRGQAPGPLGTDATSKKDTRNSREGEQAGWFRVKPGQITNLQSSGREERVKFLRRKQKSKASNKPREWTREAETNRPVCRKARKKRREQQHPEIGKTRVESND